MDFENQDSPQPAYLKSFMFLKLVIYTIFFCIIYIFSVNIMHMNMSNTGEHASSGGLVSNSIYKANGFNATIGLLFILAITIAYGKLFFREIHVLEKYNIRFFKYVLLFLFQIETILFYMINELYAFSGSSFFSTLSFDSIILNLIKNIILVVPPLTLFLRAIKKPVFNISHKISTTYSNMKEAIINKN